jgi:hypothetical protein
VVLEARVAEEVWAVWVEEVTHNKIWRSLRNSKTSSDYGHSKNSGLLSNKHSSSRCRTWVPRCSPSRTLLRWAVALVWVAVWEEWVAERVIFLRF